MSVDDRLRSLRFDDTMKSGFTTTCPIRMRSGRPITQPYLRFQLDGEAGTFRPTFRPVGREAGDRIHVFPYVGHDELLQFWDADRAEPLQTYGPGSEGIRKGFRPEVVRRAWPKLFAMAQKDGFWKEK